MNGYAYRPKFEAFTVYHLNNQMPVSGHSKGSPIKQQPQCHRLGRKHSEVIHCTISESQSLCLTFRPVVQLVSA